MTDDLRASLVTHIEGRRNDLAAFLRQHRPRNRRRAKTTMTLSSLAAVFTAGPAVGGESFSSGVQKALGLASDSYVWRTLCLCALLVSAGAAVMTGMSRSDDTARVAAAETADTEFEGLLTLLRFGHLSNDDAVKLYHQYTVKIPFVETTGQALPRGNGPVGAVPIGYAEAGGEPETLVVDLPPVPYPNARAVPRPPQPDRG